MGKCKYCGKSAGLFKDVHEECEQKHKSGVSLLSFKISKIIGEGIYDYEGIKNALSSHIQEHFITDDEFLDRLYLGISNYSISHCEDWETIFQIAQAMPESISTKIIENTIPSASFHAIRGHYFDEQDNLKINSDKEFNEKIICAQKRYPMCDFFLSEDVFLSILEKIVDKALEDGVLEDAEINEITDFVASTNLNNSERLKFSDGWQKLVKSMALSDLKEKGETDRFSIPDCPVLLGKDESIVWGFANVLSMRDVKRVKYVGGRKVGLSVQVADGIYYHQPSTPGTPIEVDDYELNGKGMLILTTKNLFFDSDACHLKIPFKNIVSFEHMRNGICVYVQGMKSNEYTFSNCDAWFIINAIRELAN